MVHETNEFRKMTEIADAINDIMQSGDTGQNGDGVAHMPPKSTEPAEMGSASPVPPVTVPLRADDENGEANDTVIDSSLPDSATATDSTGQTDIADTEAMGDMEAMEGAGQAENNLSQADETEETGAQDTGADVDAGLEAAIVAELANEPIAPPESEMAQNGMDDSSPMHDSNGLHEPDDMYESGGIGDSADIGDFGEHHLVGDADSPHMPPSGAETGFTQATGALWDAPDIDTPDTDNPLESAANMEQQAAKVATAPDGTDLHSLSLRMRDTLADLKNDNTPHQATQALFEQMKQTRTRMLEEMRTTIADFETRIGAQQATIAQSMDGMTQDMADIRAEMEMLAVRHDEESQHVHKAYSNHFAAERQRIARYRDFLRFLLRERGA